MPKRKAVVNDEKQSNSNKSTSQKQTSFKVLLARKSVSQENEEDIPSSRNLFTIPQNDEKTSSQKPSVKIRIPGSKSIALSSPNLKTGPKNLATKLVLRPTPPGKKSKSLTKGSMENNQKELAKSQVSISSEDRSNSPELSLKEEKVIKKPRNPRGESVEDSHKRQKKRSNQRERNKSLMVISSSEGEDEENDMEEEKPVKNQRISKRIANNKDKSKKKNETQKKEEKTKEPKNKKGVKAKDISSEIIITDELSEVEDVEPLLEKPGEKKSKLQRKVARKEKERITRNENKLPEFPAKEEDVGRLIVQAVNEMKSDDLEGKILEYFKKKFRSIDRKNVQTIIQHIQFSAKLRFDRGRKTITIEEESLSELSSEMSIEEISKEAPKKSQRGRKKKEVLKIEEKIEVEEEKQSLIMDEVIKQEVKEEEVPQKKKRGRPKKVIEEIEIKDEEIVKKEEYIESDTRKSKGESESVKIEGDLDVKVEEEVKPKRRRGRPASNARDKEVEKYLEEKIISEFKASFIKIEDDKPIEEKIEHDANEHKPKKRGRKSKQAIQEEMLNIQQKIEVISEDNSQIKTKTEEENRSPSKKNRKQAKSKSDENLVDLIINSHKDDLKKEASEATLFSNPETKEEKEKPKKKAKKGNNTKGEIVVVGETPEKPTKGKRSSKELEKALHDDLLEVISLNIERRATEEEKNVQEKQEKKQKKEKSKPVEIDLTSEGVMSIDKEKMKKEAEKKEKKSGEDKDQKKEKKKNKPREGKVNGNDNKENANKPKETSILAIDEKGDSEKPAGFDSLQADPKKEKTTNKNKKVDSKETLKEKEIQKNNIISIESSDEKGKKNGMTTTEKKRRHLLLDNERMKDKLRQNLVKIFEGQRSRLTFDNKPRANGGEGSVLGEKNNFLKALPKTENGDKANKQESKHNTQTFIEIDDPTPKKEMIIESEHKDIPQITQMDSLEHQTPLKIINIIEESAVKPPSTIFTKFNMHHDPFKMTPVPDTNQKDDNLLTLESPGGNNLDLDCISIVSSRIESTIQKNDYLKREDVFELRENGDMSERLMEIEHERDENNNDNEEEERYNIEQYEPAVGKKRKMNENLAEYNIGSLGETIKIMQETFPMRDSQENEFSISKFLN